MKHYSPEFKAVAVQKLLNRGNRSIEDISQEMGIHQSNIYKWRNEFVTIGDMKKSSNPHKRSANEKLKAITEYNALSVEQRGEYLRKNGLHEEHIKEWKKNIDDVLTPSKQSNSLALEKSADKKKIKHLERELRRKDKALAETAALLILKKKADLIWGVEEE